MGGWLAARRASACFGGGVTLPHMAETLAENRPPDTGSAAGDLGAAASVAEPSRHARTITDVWSWTDRKHRIRATMLLLVNLVLFCGLCVFTQWLHAGRPFDFALGSYFEPLRFWGPQTQNLYDFLLYPISIDQTPIHGIVIGLLLASIAAVPISVAILYRFGSALPFIAAVMVLAHLPWMAITLLASCILAAVRPFRMKFRFGSALLGMLPVLLYLFLATRGPSDPLTASMSPERKLLLAGPWILAILAACTMLAVVILIARLVNHRPGAVAPVMAVMFATPAVLFYARVGVDQLHYRVLESSFGPRSRCFQPVQDATGEIIALLHDWTNPARPPGPQRSTLLALWRTDPKEQEAFKRLVSHRLMLELIDKRREAYEACKDFIADHPTSRFVPGALFIQARALDTRLDERELVGETAQRKLYTDFPHVESEPVWTNLLIQYPDSPLAEAARLRVAQLRLRKGDVDGALAVLAPGPTPTATERPSERQRSPSAFLGPRPPEAGLGYEPDQDRFEARRLRELILNNRRDQVYGSEPLAALAALDPHRPAYRDQLLRLASQFPDSLLYDNLIVRWASATGRHDRRAERLLACMHRFPAGDALPEAMFELADLEIQTFGAENEPRRAAGIARLRELVARFGRTCWAQRALELLTMLDPTTRPTVAP